MIVTQNSLIARMRAGVSDSDWQRFYSLYEKAILAFAAARSLDASDSCDVLQETMIKILRGGLGRFDPAKGRFSAFLFTIAHGCAIDAVRRRDRRQSRHVSLDASANDSAPLHAHLADRGETPADVAERQGQMMIVMTALDFLIQRKCFQTKTIAIFKAVTFERKEVAEIAAAFQTTPGNVYQAKHTVLTRLHLILEGLDRGLDLDQAVAVSTSS